MKYIRGKYKSKKTGKVECYDSSFELRRFKFLDSRPEVKTWTRSHKIRIPYVNEGRIHRYEPDILITYNDGSQILEEVKGYIRNLKVVAKKNRVAISYCKSRGWTFRIIFEKDLEVLL